VIAALWKASTSPLARRQRSSDVKHVRTVRAAVSLRLTVVIELLHLIGIEGVKADAVNALTHNDTMTRRFPASSHWAFMVFEF